MTSRYQRDAAPIYSGDNFLVYQARDLQDHNRLLALKTLNCAVPDAARNAALAEEARQLAAVRHRNIVALHAFYPAGELDDSGCGCLLTEWMDTTLAQWLPTQPRFTQEQILHLLGELLNGTAALHNANIIHRDLHPANILLNLNPTGTTFTEVRIADLETACATDDNTTLTRRFTPKYTAPEAYDPAHRSVKLDLYALGFITYELLLGEHFQQVFPFDAESPAERSRRWENEHASQEAFAPLHSIDPAIPLPLSGLIAKLIAKDPGQRFASCNDALQALRATGVLPDGLIAADWPSSATPAQKRWLPTARSGMLVLGFCVSVVIGSVSYSIYKTDSEFDTQYQALLDARQLALTTGDANHPLFDDAENDYQQVQTLLANNEWKAASPLIQSATRYYEATVWQPQADRARQDNEATQAQVSTAGISRGSDFEAAQTEARRAQDSYTAGDYRRATGAYQQAQQLYEQLLQERLTQLRPRVRQSQDAAQNARTAAINNAAQTEPAFQRAEQLLRQAQAQFGRDELREAETSFNHARLAYQEAQAARLRGLVQHQRTEAEQQGLAGDSADFDNARWEQERGETTYSSGSYPQAIGHFERAHGYFVRLFQDSQRLPILFRAGSTPEEQAAALALCHQYRPDCQADWYAAEAEREVRLKPFLLDRQPVSLGQFAAFVAATGHRTVAEQDGFARLFTTSGQVEQRAGYHWRAPDGPMGDLPDPDQAVRYIAQTDAAAYCAWSGQRLPSEEEFEFKTRGRERRQFAWGDTLVPARALVAVAFTTSPDTDSTATPEGLLDLSGGVWEWTASLTGDGRAVLKGGSFAEANPAHLRAAARLALPLNAAFADVGFRCARDAARWDTQE